MPPIKINNEFSWVLKRIIDITSGKTNWKINSYNDEYINLDH